MRYSKSLIVLPLAMLFTSSACAADRRILISYAHPPAPQRLTGPKLILLPLLDARGNEGDHGDPLRVGGIYGGYGNRIVKLMTQDPWPSLLLTALRAEFRARGIEAEIVNATSYPTGVYRLSGEIRNFSTESRWGRRAHISGYFTLRTPDDRTVVNKEFKAVAERYHWNNYDVGHLNALLNEAFALFVRTVATDQEILGHLKP